MPDIWWFCSDCRRWYYSGPQATSVCPVCEAEPSASQDRAAPATPPVSAPLTSSAQA